MTWNPKCGFVALALVVGLSAPLVAQDPASTILPMDLWTATEGMLEPTQARRPPQRGAPAAAAAPGKKVSPYSGYITFENWRSEMDVSGAPTIRVDGDASKGTARGDDRHGPRHGVHAEDTSNVFVGPNSWGPKWNVVGHEEINSSPWSGVTTTHVESRSPAASRCAKSGAKWSSSWRRAPS